MKIDFPLNTELPLRGGGVAVLYEFFDGRWFGRAKSNNSWIPWTWNSEGRYGNPRSYDHLDILPPKRKAWVVWGPRTLEICSNQKAALIRAEEVCGHAQEVTET